MDPERWLQEHGDYLFGYAMARVQDRTLAEDMVQETLLAAIQARDRFQGDSTERTWLVGILKHKILDYLRRNQREIPVAEVLAPDEEIESLFDARGKWKEGPIPWQDDLIPIWIRRSSGKPWCGVWRNFQAVWARCLLCGRWKG